MKMHTAMASTPPSHLSEPRLRIKSVSPLPPIGVLGGEAEDLAPSPQPKKTTSPSHVSLRSSTNSVPLHELLLLSPSPLRRSRTRLLERTEMAEEALDPVAHRRRCKSRAASMVAVLACPSPRNARKSRRRMEQEIREERDLGLGDEVGKPRKRKQSSRPRREKLSIVPSVPSSSLSPRSSDEDQSNLDRIGRLISDLIMWKDVAKSSLWFGFGSLCFLSSCFSSGLSFSLFSVVSQLGLLFLGLSFFCNSLSQRNKEPKKQDFKLKEDDIIRATQVILPAANLAISKTRELFSGEPSMTLKVAPILLFGAEYGNFITLRKLIATGFFVSFTAPKLYSCYAERINKQVEYLRCWVSEAWGACSHKKIVAASAATVFWNLSCLKTRIFAAFFSVVILRYYRQQSEAEAEDVDEHRQQQHQALVVVEEGSLK